MIAVYFHLCARFKCKNEQLPTADEMAYGRFHFERMWKESE